ncbi:MAG: NADPH-dependent glutamate synthase [Spirochaetales bacterium]|nr:NADPH-dependent glutamate synthase [Spirochaetales bacterium]
MSDVKTLTTKERLAIAPQMMPEQDPLVRITNMEEVACGFTAEQVMAEASRCLDCKNAPCVKGCPVSIDIPGFVKAAEVGDFAKSIEIIRESSLLPAICGRVCPQEKQCQMYCTVGKSLKDVEKSVGIGRIERFVADYDRAQGNSSIPNIAKATGKKVAIVGTGPASISAAADCRKAGHEVVMFEAFHKPGGVLVYGIPEFRLPKAIVEEEINTLRKMGVEIRLNFLVGRTRKLKDLIDQDGFDAVFVGTGAGLPNFLNIPGENLVGVFSANEYLTRSNLMKAYARGEAETPIYQSKRVAVVGGGNVAMDAARMAKRLGAQEVHVIYRRNESDMPARIEEVHHAKQEQIVFHFLRNIKEIKGDADSRVCEVVLSHYKEGEPDEQGRRRPELIPGENSTMPMDTVIIAVGNVSNPLIKQTTSELVTNKWGNIEVDESFETSIKNIYAGGDIVSGAATVILAMGQGREAAAAINKRLAK